MQQTRLFGPGHTKQDRRGRCTRTGAGRSPPRVRRERSGWRQDRSDQPGNVHHQGTLARLLRQQAGPVDGGPHPRGRRARSDRRCRILDGGAIVGRLFDDFIGNPLRLKLFFWQLVEGIGPVGEQLRALGERKVDVVREAQGAADRRFGRCRRPAPDHDRRELRTGIPSRRGRFRLVDGAAHRGRPAGYHNDSPCLAAGARAAHFRAKGRGDLARLRLANHVLGSPSTNRYLREQPRIKNRSPGGHRSLQTGAT